MYRRRRYSSRGRSSRSRLALRQQGYRSFSSRAAGFVQPRVTRAPRTERCKFLELNWDVGVQNNYFVQMPMVCNLDDEGFDPATQGCFNKRWLNLVVTGSGPNDRASARIMMKSIIIRGSAYYCPMWNNLPATPARVAMGSTFPSNTGVNTPMNPVVVDRMVNIFVVYYPRYSTSTGPPSWSSLLESPTNTRSGLDETNILGARVIMRKQFRLSVVPVGGNAASPMYAVGRASRRDFAWKVNLNLPTEFDSSVGNVPSGAILKYGHLMIFALSNVITDDNSHLDVGSYASPYISLRARLAFVDA